MKRSFQILTTVLCAGALLASCAEKEESKDAPSREIRFKASVGNFEVKATDTSFEEGDAVGLFAQNFIVMENIRLTYSGGSLIPETPIYWNPDMGTGDSAYFYAYYPYNKSLLDYGSTNFNFQVPQDQRSLEAYQSANLMTAHTVAYPTDESVVLNFVHRMVKMDIQIECKLEGVEITDVYVGNVCNWGWYDIGDPNNYDWWGERVVIKAHRMAAADGSPIWSLILPPQTARPSLVMVAADGSQYNYEATQDLSFYPGNRYTARAVVDETAVSTDFMARVSDWWDAGEYEFGQKQPSLEGNWSLIGSLSYYGMGWDWDMDMEVTQTDAFGDGFRTCYAAYLPYKQGDEFKFRRDHQWVIDFGREGYWGDEFTPVTSYEVLPLSIGGPNIQLDQDGWWAIYLDVNAQEMVAYWYMELEEENPEELGNGTLEDPFTIPGAVRYIRNTGEQTEKVFVKGVISAIRYPFDEPYGTATFWISDDGTNYGISEDRKTTTDPERDFQCYSTFFLEGFNWKIGNTQIKVGDEVILYGSLKEFNGIYETVGKEAYIYSLNGVTHEVIETGWGITGTLMGLEWGVNPDVQMVYDAENNVYSAEIRYYLGEQFKFRKNNAWDENLGGFHYDGYELGEGAQYEVYQNGYNLGLDKSGRWELILNAEELWFQPILLEEFGQVEYPDGATVTVSADFLAAAPCKGVAAQIDDILSFTNTSDYGTNTVTELRIYKGKVFKLSVLDGFLIKEIKIICTAQNNTKAGPGCWGSGAPEGYSYEGYEGYWSGSSQSVEFMAVDNQVRITELTVTYQKNAE
ncbi:MAG: fimbrillin family protein [Bacteroidales bacterium]|nr:fimbrillin family protein [Bacteroidales bacterium]